MTNVPDVMPISGGPFLIAARLCNFPTGRAVLLPKHSLWLTNDLGGVMNGTTAPWVDVVGYASKLGDPRANLRLSRARCESVKVKVRARNSRATFNIELPKGESESLGGETNNDGYWRAVDVYVYGARPPKPRRSPPKPAPDLGSTEFEIRVVGGGSASVLAQADFFYFQIVDLSNRLTAFYFYTGGGLGISIPKVPGPGSATKAGKPTRFTTGRPVQLHAFNSRASLFQDPGATAGPVSVGGTLRVHFEEVHDHLGFVGTRPSIIPIEGGAGIQMPGLGSATKGVFALASSVFPFTGY